VHYGVEHDYGHKEEAWCLHTAWLGCLVSLNPHLEIGRDRD
jgi:hypothetical protein